MQQKADQFVAKYNGKKIDEDGHYGTQCWDVAARYAREMYGCPSFPTGSGGAEGCYRLFSSLPPLPKFFDRIANDTNDPNQMPLKGDIIVWNNQFSPPWGHIALVLGADNSGVTVFEQNGGNDPNRDGVADGVAYIIKRAWSPKISGWLRPKQGGSMEQRIKNLEASEKRLAQEVVDRDKALAARDKRIKALEESEQKLANVIAARDKRIAELEQGSSVNKDSVLKYVQDNLK